MFSFNIEKEQMNALSKHMKLHFDLSRNNSIMLRESTLKLVDLTKEAEKRPSPAIVLTGPRGVGKSVTLFNVAYHYSQLSAANRKDGSIVMYFPDLSNWTCGKYEYESTPDGSYIQPTLAVKILNDLLEANSKSLLQVSSPNDKFKNLAEFIKSGANNVKLACQVLNDALDHLFNPSTTRYLFFNIRNSNSNTRPFILLALDQVNALYCSTAYCDKNSVPISADRLSLAAKLQKILATDEIKNCARLISVDDSQPQIKSHYLNSIIASSPLIHSDPLDISSKKYLELNNVSEFGVDAPAALDPSLEDSFPKIPVSKLNRFTVPIFTQTETLELLKHYQNCQLVEEGEFF